jgi:hypothetical protein
VVEQFMDMHDESEICLIQNDYDDPFNEARVDFYGINAWPTVVGNGLSDAWPLACLEDDYQAHDATPSPLTIMITENGVGDFTVEIMAEQTVTDAAFFMVVTLDEDVPGAEGLTHLPHHVKLHLTLPNIGDPFSLMAGETAEINRTFDIDPGWDYDLMGVAAWVSRSGGTNPSPCPYGDISVKNEVLQSRWVPAGGSVAIEPTTWSHVKSLYR